MASRGILAHVKTAGPSATVGRAVKGRAVVPLETPPALVALGVQGRRARPSRVGVTVAVLPTRPGGTRLL